MSEYRNAVAGHVWPDDDDSVIPSTREAGAIGSSSGAASFQEAYQSARNKFASTEWDVLALSQQAEAIYVEMRRLDAAAIGVTRES